MAYFVPVIISGGAGSRLWPVSREALPKPFIKLADGQSLLAKTLRRALGCADGNGVLTVTNRDYFFITRDEYGAVVRGDPQLDFLLEPVSRNTAPAMCAAALDVSKRHGKDAVVLVLPADHLIKDEKAFGAAVGEARKLAEQGWLVTFGIEPSRPETGFGYIEAGDKLGEMAGKVKRFVEKPDLATAEGFVSSGRYTWNSGKFCFTAEAGRAAFKKNSPEILSPAEAAM